MLCHTRKSKRPQWREEYKELHSETLWRVLRDYDMDVVVGRNHVEDRYQSIKPFAFNMWSYDGAYFNASRIKFQLPDFACDMYEGNLYDGVVVGMQAPLPHTLDRFVKALIAEKVDIIVTLGGSAEGERRKMEPYWNGYKSSECTIEKVRELDAVVGVERHLRVTCHNLDGKLKRRAVIQLHYDDWLDHTTPDPKKFKALVRDVAPFCCAEKPRVIVHCSAGVGRTGTLISALRCHLIRKAELANKWTPTNRAPTNRASTNPPSRSNDISTSREEEEPLYRPIGRWVDAAAAVMTAAEATTVQTPSLMQLVFESVAIAKEQRFLSVESKEQFEFLTTLSFP